MVKKIVKTINKKQNGGDGYVINVNEAIGGLPAFSRYSNNYRPIFEGELLENGGNEYSMGVCENIDNTYTYNYTPIFQESLFSNGGGNKKKTLKGGDGYSVGVGVGEDIGGMSQYNRYTYNDTPIFEGSLLSNGGGRKKKKALKGGDGYSIDVSEDIGGMPQYNRYTCNDTPIFEGSLLSNGGGKKKKALKGGKCGCSGNSDPQEIFDFLKQTGAGNNCKCNDTKNDESIFELIKQNGGVKKNKITQFEAIKETTNLLLPLSTNSLTLLVSKIFINSIEKEKPTKAKQMGGYIDKLQDILAPLGKNNLLVLSSLLLLHYFAVESQENKKTKKLVGGNAFTSNLSEILAPLGINSVGTSLLLILLHQSFVKTEKSKKQTGGNPLKNLIAPLGTNAFIASGLLVLIAKLFTNRVNQLKSTDKKKKELIGGKVDKKFDELFNLLAPITFNTFAKDSTIKMTLSKMNKENNSKK